MSSQSQTIIITKGLPIDILVGLTNKDVDVDLNDGTWTVTPSLRHMTERGAEPFPITGTPSGNSVLISLTDVQTAQLDSRQNDYVFVIKADKDDGSVYIRNILAARAVNDL